MRAWCSHCRAGVDDKRSQHVREHGALIGDCNVLPSETPAAPVPAVWHPQDGPVPDGMDITHSSCWRSAAVRRFPRQHNASDSRVPFPEAETQRRSQGQPLYLSFPSPCSALTGGYGSWRCLVRGPRRQSRASTVLWHLSPPLSATTHVFSPRNLTCSVGRRSIPAGALAESRFTWRRLFDNKIA
jgi:hypothetical protein